MTDKEKEEFLAYVEKFLKEVEGNKELSLNFLNRVGICTMDGKLTEPYKHLYIPRN